MKKIIVLGFALAAFGCASTDTTETLPPSAQEFQVPTQEQQWQAEQERIGKIVQNTDWDTIPCVRCQFSEQEQEINALIKQEMEEQHAAYEALIAQGVPEEEAATMVFVQKKYQKTDKTTKPARQMK